ncbi:MAG: aromatic amino acid hydroxylase [Bdellovibrionales bacterium]|nr:aromatic amino acid hydroxylase [Bdellovibrionales bacterium]
MKNNLPSHLKPYIVTQKNSEYTPEDHAVWRFALRQLTFFLKTNAHPFYLEGLKKTGITVDKIPSIDSINTALQKIGWHACPVSGFIPPSVFMELQSYSVLPIAAEIRSVDHILYTPSPDIIHEAAGHAPFLAHKDYSDYLKSYANIAKKALLSFEDLDLYEKIRDLSNLKESKSSTDKQIQNAESELKTVIKNTSFISEAAYLGRMNWWTAEYALFGDINNPSILGAGLLSSILEAESCLKPDVKKIPLTVDCTNYNYDITKPQPQLFVAKDFKNLHNTLNEFSKNLVCNIGGDKAVDKAKQSKLVNTVELNSGLQISGKLVSSISCNNASADSLGGALADSLGSMGEDFIKNNHTNIFLKFDGPTQLSYKNQELKGHDKNYHVTGYSTPIGFVGNVDLSQTSKKELKDLNIEVGKKTLLNFDSNIKLNGTVVDLLFKDNKLLLISFKNCCVKYKDKILFDPSWGAFDLAVGTKVLSVFAGPADTAAYNSDINVQPKYITKIQASIDQQNYFLLYEELYQVRQSFLKKNNISKNLDSLFKKIKNQKLHWLILLELYELSIWSDSPINPDVLSLLNSLDLDKHDKCCLKKGLSIAKQI